MSKASYKQRSKDRRNLTIRQNTEARAKRTPEQQLAHLDAGGHRALKERARLTAQINGR